MKHAVFQIVLATAVAAVAWLSDEGASDSNRSDAQSAPRRFPSVDEARQRARLLHETLHGALQVMHRDFFDDEDSTAIPSRSLEDVFVELEKSHNVSLRWLAVNAQPMSLDNRAGDDFEKRAVAVLADGTAEFESVDDEEFRFAGSIVLASQCLKCHAPMRTSTKDQYAALSITIPLKEPPQQQMP